MVDHLNIKLALSQSSHARLTTEICEHKGIGHPDSICDGVVEAVSQALCAAYIDAYGEIRHHNVDKALLIGGQSAPRFGGGELETPMRLIVAGRADPLPGVDDVGSTVHKAARDYIAATLRCPADRFEIEPVVRCGSPSLRNLVSSGLPVPLANDTSFGVGFAPYSMLETAILDAAEWLKSASFRAAFPMAGDDFKVMGMRVEHTVALTIALAIVDREIQNVEHYFCVKQDIAKWLAGNLKISCNIRINALDDPGAKDESGIYLTVTGLSAEHGDDGQVGRGNRVSGLITPSRPMSLEAAAGKNPVSHVGKIYNVLATKLANDLVSRIPVIREATIQILSCIGQPINRPQLVDIQIVSAMPSVGDGTARRVREVVRDQFDAINSLTSRLSRGELRVF